jgi:hypothetical protein
MPSRDEALRYIAGPATGPDELRRACRILGLDAAGDADQLRRRLLAHLDTLEARRPIVCLNPGPLAPRAGRAGPAVPRPAPGDHPATFAAEVALVPDVDDFAGLLEAQLDITRALALTFGEAHAGLRPAPGKWSVTQVIGHLADCERVLAYRMLRLLRGDDTALAGFDQDAYVPAGAFDARALADVVEEHAAVRASTCALVRSAAPARYAFRGRVGSGTITAAAIAYVIAGHERHHQESLRARYVPLLPPLA